MESETWRQAIRTLSNHTFSTDEVLLEDTTAWAASHDEEERLDTAKDGLLY